MPTVNGKRVLSGSSKSSSSSSSSSSKKSNQNYATSLASGGSVTVKNGVKTYSDKPLQVSGKNGISISGKDYSVNKGGSGYAPVITADSVSSVPDIKLPSLAAPTNVPDVSALNTALNNPTTGTTVDNTGKFTVDQITQDSINRQTNSFLDYYKAKQENQTPDIIGIQKKLDRQTGIDNLKAQEADYTGQLNSIVANRDANILKAEGQGRGIPDVIIGGQQAQINKEAAIQALPVQAQLAAVQGKIQVANDYINKWGALLVQDATNKYNQKNALIDAVYTFGNDIEKQKLTSLQAQAKEKKDAEIALAQAKTKAISQALSQPGGAAVVSAITLATDEAGVVTALGKYNGDLLAQEAQRAKNQSITLPTGEQVTVPTFEEYIAAREQELQMTLTPQKREELRAKYNAEIEVINQANTLAKLSPEAAAAVRDPKGFSMKTATEKGKVLDELARSGIDTSTITRGVKKQLPISATDDLAQAQIARNNVKTLYEMLKAVPGTGPIAGRVKALNPYDPQVAAIQAQITRTVPGLARGIFKEVGVLTDSDVERYRQTLANLNFTDEQIEALNRDTMSAIDYSINTTTDTYDALGYDIGTFSLPDIQAKAPDNLTDEEAYAEYLKKTQ